MDLKLFLLGEYDSGEVKRRSDIFKMEISRKAKELADKFGVSSDLLVHVLSETAEISPSLPPDDQEARILESGFNPDDLKYNPSIEHALTFLGPEKAIQCFKNDFGRLLSAWSFYQTLVPWYSFSTLFPLLLTEKEWIAYLGEYLGYLESEKSELIKNGRPKKLPQVSFLLRVLPVSLLNDDRIWECRKLEAEGGSPEEIERLFLTPKEKSSTSALFEEFILATDPELPDRSYLEPFREKIHSLYSSGAKALVKNLRSNSVDQLAYELSKVISRSLNAAQMRELRELEDLYTMEYSVFSSDSFEKSTIPDSKIPIALYNFIFSFSLPVFEVKTKKYSDLRAKLSQYVRSTALGFPRIDFNFWDELKKNPEDCLKTLSEANVAFEQTQDFAKEFVLKVMYLLSKPKNENSKAHTVYEPKFEDKELTDDEDSESISEIFTSIEARAIEKTAIKIEGTDYIFKNGFRELHWNSHKWGFKEWERKIVEALFEAYKRDGYLTADQVNEMAQRLHFKQYSAVQKKRYMFTDVFKDHKLSGKFIIAYTIGQEKKTGKYTLNPKWTPKTK